MTEKITAVDPPGPIRFTCVTLREPSEWDAELGPALKRLEPIDMADHVYLFAHNTRYATLYGWAEKRGLPGDRTSVNYRGMELLRMDYLDETTGILCLVPRSPVRYYEGRLPTSSADELLIQFTSEGRMTASRIIQSEPDLIPIREIDSMGDPV